VKYKELLLCCAHLLIAYELVPHIIKPQHINGSCHHLQPLPWGGAGWKPATAAILT
jgi:hypothetical protein